MILAEFLFLRIPFTLKLEFETLEFFNIINTPFIRNVLYVTSFRISKEQYVVNGMKCVVKYLTASVLLDEVMACWYN